MDANDAVAHCPKLPDAEAVMAALRRAHEPGFLATLRFLGLLPQTSNFCPKVTEWRRRLC